MPTITAIVKESNERRDDLAFLNGITVTSNLTIAGNSEKQIDYAKKVLDAALAALVKGYFETKGLKGYCNGSELDKASAEINAQLNRFALMLDGASAKSILDNKGRSAKALIQAVISL